jgi:flagellar hook-associated protein 2
MSTSPIPPPAFNGTSKYASDFQQVLIRAVSIASLPLQQLQNGEITLTQQETALGGLQSTFSSLQNAIQGLGTAQSAMSAAVSDTSTVSATASSTALPGAYTIQVTNLGSSTTTLSNPGTPVVTDPTSGNISSSATFTLTINGTGHTITPSGTSLQALAGAINNAGLPVQATIVNVGSTASPDYRLSIASNNLAADTIQLNDGTNDLLTTLSTGTPATYQVDGLNTSIQSNSRQVTLSPGLTVSLLKTNVGQWATITVAPNTGSLSSGLSTFAGAYNAAVDALAQQHGQNAGPLAGHSLITSLGQALQNISLYTAGSGSATSLADLGLSLDSTTGHLTLDASKLNNLSVASIQHFLGSATSGGFLQNATSTMTSIADSSSGMIHGDVSSVQDEINRQNDLITKEQDRINTLQTNLQQQLAEADAAIAVLQQQVTMMSDLFQAQYGSTSNSGSGSSNSAGH